MTDLTNKQKAFIEEYLLDYNATRAAERAGYGGNENTLASIGCENLTKPKIAERIAERMRAKAMTADEVLLRMAEQARGEQSQFLTPEGIDMEALLTAGKGHLIKGIKHTRYGDDIEFYDAQSALSLIGKHLGLFKDQLDTTITIYKGYKKVSPDDWDDDDGKPSDH